ncbi:hypothetical protein FRC07_001877 [Ceratobasidium sp. 392]|nr:hypothetical protein FRC07_001877 [Ceratobasidium sp. 392]
MAQSSTVSTNLPPVLSSEKHPARFAQMINAVARTRRVLIICGDSASRECGLPTVEEAVDVHYGAETRRVSLRTLLRDCAPTTVSPDVVDTRLLISMNKAMATRRALARSSPAGTFYQFLARTCAEGRLVGCLTDGFDGLETRGDPALEQKTVMLHGDNRVLRCCRRSCQGLSEADTLALDAKLFGSPDSGPLPTVDDIWCQRCLRKWKKQALVKRECGERSMLLRPAVQLQLPGELIGKEIKARLMGYAEQSQLLLIVGLNFKPRSELDYLVSDLADVLHKRSGGVMYVSTKPLRGRNMWTHIDAQLEIDPAELGTRVLQEADQLSMPSLDEGSVVYDGDDFWFDIVSSELAAVSRPEEAPYENPVCEHCSCGEADYLINCRSCSSCFCFRQISFDESPSFQLDEQGIVPGEDLLDEFPFEQACVILNHYSQDGSRPPLVEAKKEFECPDCWKRTGSVPYPHYVKPVPRLRPEYEAAQRPRFAMVIFYVEQFWPEAKHFMTLVSGRWASKGWSCAIEPVKLEHLTEKGRLFKDITWEKGSYRLFVVYLTHGLTGDQGYQLGHGKALQPVPLFEHTLSGAKPIMSGAAETRCFVLCCGHPLYHSGLVATLHEWFNSDKGLFDSLLATMNTKMSPAYTANFLAALSTTMTGPDRQPEETMLRRWISDSVAVSHTDMLCLVRGRQPELWLYAPFQSRPLGRPLPSIMATCTCPDVPHGEFRVVKRHRSRKVWEVDHNGRDGVPLREVRVKATCTICRQMWPLMSHHMAGTLRKYSGIYAAVLPYFPSPASATSLSSLPPQE